MKKYLLALFVSISASAFAAQADQVLADFTSNEGIFQDTWAGTNAATISSGILTVAAKDTNGFIEFQPINATGYGFLAITAKVNALNQSGFAVQFLDDNNLTEYSVLIPASSFTSEFTTVYVPLNWATSAIGDISAITSWSFGGGSVGSNNFNYSIDKIALVTSNIPEPSTFAAIAGLMVLGAVASRRRRNA